MFEEKQKGRKPEGEGGIGRKLRIREVISFLKSNFDF